MGEASAHPSACASKFIISTPGLNMNAKILVIDDEECIQYTFREFLTEEGYDVDTAGSYREAVSALKSIDYDLVFTDIILKGKTGIEILKTIRSRNIDCPVIVITGVPEMESATSALRLGAFDYISKPVMQEQLINVTKRALEKKLKLEREKTNYDNMKAIFRSVNDAIITMDKDLVILEANKAAKRICELPEGAIGRKFNMFTEQCEGKCLLSVANTLKYKQTDEMFHVQCRKRKNMNQTVNVTTYPLRNESGNVIGTVLVVKDKSVSGTLKKSRCDSNKFHRIVTKSEKMQSVLSAIENLADVQTTVLITGESGTGKELVAEAIHYGGIRKNKPLVKVNCSALSESLLESELFGHVKGAFTGAVQDKTGRFQKADGGTVFLDEIGDLSPKLQLKLLRVLQDKEFERVGDSTPVKVDVRIIAATHQYLKKMIMAREFREDLYYRLNVIPISIPSLRDRDGDIPILANHFMEKFSNINGKNIHLITDEAMAILHQYPWPGNVRELENMMERTVILNKGTVIEAEDLSERIRGIEESSTPPKKGISIPDTGISFKHALSAFENELIIKALEKTNWNKNRAAILLKINRTTLVEKIKKKRLGRSHVQPKI